MSAADSLTPTAALTRAVSRLLRPLVWLLISRGITLPTLTHMLRELYLDVARDDILRDAQARTDSRISLLTGIHRKELRRQRTGGRGPGAEPPMLSLSSRIVSLWLSRPPWSTGRGKPLPLPRVAPVGRLSFDALVGSVTSDVRPRTVLDEWLSAGLAELDAHDRVVLKAAAYLPRPGSDEQLHYFGRNLHDHIAAAAANVTAESTPPFLERAVHYDGLTAAQADALMRFARAEAERALLAVNRAALAILNGEAGPGVPPAASERVNFGLFVYRAAELPTDGAADNDA
jgi:hypothetical protein